VALLLLLLLRTLSVWPSQNNDGRTEISAVAIVHSHD
jgi:hypothetical protein